MNKQQEPRLRFQGFTGAWQEKTIFELAQDNKLNNGVFNDKNKAGSGYKLINVLDMYLENGIDENTLQLLDLSHDEFLRNKVNYGDVFFTRSSLVKEGIAYSNTYLGNSNDVTYDGHLIKLTPNKNLVSPIFLNYELKTAAVRRQFIIGGKTTTMTTIGQQEIGESIVMLPLLPEQTHLGLFFSRLDSQIAESRAVLEKSRQLKKAMLAKMFPANGEKIPKIRFKGFEGEWECRKLGIEVEIIGGGTPDTTNSAYWNGDIDWYSPTEIGEAAYANGSVKKITLLGLQKSSAQILPANRTVLFTSRASIGDMAILTKDGATNQGFQSFVVREKLDVYFLYTMGFKIKDYALKNASGSTFLEISKNTLSQMEFFVPSLKEQTQIGNFFRQLDETIALQSAEVEKLNQLKKGLLAAMLV